jgi:uncharacterized protein involved in cysteine biosynthesis
VTPIFRSVSLAVQQLTDAPFRRVLLVGIGLALVLLVAVSSGFVWLVDWLAGDSITLPFIGEVTWLDTVFSWGAAALLLVLSAFLMIPVASAITSLLLDDVADAVEAKHYPDLPKANRVSLADGLRDSIGFLGVLIGANMLALVLYVIFAPLAPLIFWGLNGFLLGREYFTLAAIRRVGLAEAKRLRRRHIATIWTTGVVMAVPLTVPVLNLIVPLLGAATFTHLFHQLVSSLRAAKAQYPRQ